MITRAYQHLVIPSFETFWKGRKTFRFLKQLEESQWWAREQLRALQLRRLSSLVEYCFRHSAYYRELWRSHGLSSSTLQSLDDFHRWPIMHRQQMHDHAARIRSDVRDLKVVTKATGGSSGVPLRFVIDLEANDRRVAAAHRGYGWAGGSPGTRQTHFWGVTLGNPSALRRWKEHVYARWLYRRDVISSFDVSDKAILEFTTRLRRYRPDVLVAYTNPLYVAARVIEQSSLPVPPLKAVIVGAERLHGFQRELIERVFAAPVFETYGSREFTLIGAECEQHEGLHITAENLLVEVVDDDGYPVPDGQEGHVIVTDLTNRAMPFVRYALGDRAVAASGICPCGRGLPRLKKITGRQLDVLVTVDGRRLAGEFFPHLLKDHISVRQFQVVQPEPDVIELKLVTDSGWDEISRDALRAEVQDAVGASTRVLIHEVDDIPLTAAGKLRVVMGCNGMTRPRRHAG